MNHYLHNVCNLFEDVLHPAAGKMVIEKKRKRSAAKLLNPKGTPDSMNIRDFIKRQDSFRRNPAP